MRIGPLGWATDLAILEHTGSVVEEHRTHLVIRSAHNPDFHWGNCLLVTDEDSLGDAQRWVATFRLAFPEASWVAIGLIRIPEDPGSWVAQGLDLEVDDVLTTATLPRRVLLPEGYTVRRFRDGDWAQALAQAVAENDRTGEEDQTSFQRFAQAQTQARRALSQRDLAAWFGAFENDTLVAELGIVRCGATARYQSVGTHAGHRRRGLASHLLGVAAQWAADGGCDQWVIATEPDNSAGRVYRSLGFTADTGAIRAYRRPQR